MKPEDFFNAKTTSHHEEIRHRLDRLENIILKGQEMRKGECRDDILTIEKVCTWLDIPKSTLDVYRNHHGLPFHKPGKKVFFVKSEVIEWLLNFKR